MHDADRSMKVRSVSLRAHSLCARMDLPATLLKLCRATDSRMCSPSSGVRDRMKCLISRELRQFLQFIHFERMNLFTLPLQPRNGTWFTSSTHTSIPHTHSLNIFHLIYLSVPILFILFYILLRLLYHFSGSFLFIGN